MIAALAVLLLTARAFCYDAKVEDVSGTKYFPAVKQAIEKAQQSVSVVMFTLEPDKKPGQLVDALIEAHKRGVKVEVVLDQNVDFVRGDIREPKVKSNTAFRRLKEAGVSVWYDEPARYTHAKACIIDQRIVFVGSTNWTGNSFDNNIETNVRIESPQLAQEMLGYLSAIKLDKRVGHALEADAGAVPISRAFLEDPALGGYLVRQQAERAFDLYLYLLWRFDGNPENRMVLFYDDAARYLGIFDGWTAEEYRRQIIKVLKKLDEKFKLIEFKPRYAKEAEVTLLEYTDTRAAYRIPQEQLLMLPEDYFTYGWHRELSLRAKYCLLVNLLYAPGSNVKPYWSKSVATIARECGRVGQDVVYKGMNELRRKQLLSVRYDALGAKPYDLRRPKMYKPLPFYDPLEQEAALAGVKEKYGNEAFKQAQEFAAIVFEENNPAVLEEIILKVRALGQDRVRRVFAEVARKNIDNPKRSYEYVSNVLKGRPSSL